MLWSSFALLLLLLACFFFVEKAYSFEHFLPECKNEWLWCAWCAGAIIPVTVIAVAVVVIVAWAAVATFTITLVWFLCVRHNVGLVYLLVLALGVIAPSVRGGSFSPDAGTMCFSSSAV